MENCLVTKLKESVNNDNLMEFGHWKIQIKAVTTPSEDAQIIRINGAQGTKIKVVGNGVLAPTYAELSGSTIKEMTIPASGTITFCCSNGNYILDISDKYNLTAVARRSNLGVYNFDIDEFKYSDKVSQITLTGNFVSGDISGMSNKPYLVDGFDFSGSNVSGNIEGLTGLSSAISTICLYNTSVSGNIASLANYKSLVALILDHTNVSGNIQSLGDLTSLTTLSLYPSNVGGSVEEFVSGQCNAANNPRTSCNRLGCAYVLTYATFGGNLHSDVKRAWLSWENENKIAVHCDTTGTQTFEEASKIYCKGYGTQAQAEAAFPGKTVVRVDA